MKKISIFIIFAIVSQYSYSQIKCDITKHYGDFISIKKTKYDGREYLEKKIDTTASKKCFSNLVNNSNVYIDYLLTNFSSNKNYKTLLQIQDSAALQKEYIQELEKDSSFNSVMSNFAEKTIEKSKPKDTVSMDKVLNIAVKFFSIIGINDKGDYEGKTCVGINSIKTTEKIRQPQIEAFCFSSVLKNYEGDKYNLSKEFIKSMKELYKINLGIDKKEQLLRAQGAVFFLMRDNAVLKNMLIDEYEKNKESLPFILNYK